RQRHYFAALVLASKWRYPDNSAAQDQMIADVVQRLNVGIQGENNAHKMQEEIMKLVGTAQSKITLDKANMLKYKMGLNDDMLDECTIFQTAR
ncbi:MAG: hypothetical protein AAF352_09105, partial [Pseudomonadota bacterium]